MINDANILIVAAPFPSLGGGCYRALLSIKEYKKRGLNLLLILPWGCMHALDLNEKVISLKNEGISFIGFSILPQIFPRKLPGGRFLTGILALSYPKIAKIVINENLAAKSKCIISLHESFDALTTTLFVSEKFSLKKAILLQLPPFYVSTSRIKNIDKALDIWNKVMGTEYSLASKLLKLSKKKAWKVTEDMLKHFDLVWAVSKSIPIEMGEYWRNKVRVIDPGVFLSPEDIQLINAVAKKIKEKKDIVVFNARPVPEKGVVEALIAWKKIIKNTNQKLKLIITGNIRPYALNKLKVFTKKLGIIDKVVFTGFIPREKHLEIVAKARMMLYPSHVDSFSYAVLEALYLNTPVVAYDIPALKTYYGGLNGVTLVKESDIEALVQKSIEVINQKTFFSTEKPKFKNWNEIMNEEINLIKKLLQ